MTMVIVKRKGFHPYEDMSDFEKFKVEFPSKEKFNSFLTEKKIVSKEYELLLMFGTNLK